MADLKGLFSSASNEWETPQELFDELDAQYRFTLDAASTDENAKCERHYTQDCDGLAQNWGGACLLQSSLRPRNGRVGAQVP